MAAGKRRHCQTLKRGHSNKRVEQHASCCQHEQRNNAVGQRLAGRQGIGLRRCVYGQPVEKCAIYTRITTVAVQQHLQLRVRTRRGLRISIDGRIGKDKVRPGMGMSRIRQCTPANKGEDQPDEKRVATSKPGKAGCALRKSSEKRPDETEHNASLAWSGQGNQNITKTFYFACYAFHLGLQYARQR